MVTPLAKASISTQKPVPTNASNQLPHLTDPLQAYTAPDFNSQHKIPQNGTVIPRMAPHFEYKSDIEKVENKFLANSTIRQIVNEATNNPKSLLSNKTVVDVMRSVSENLQTNGEISQSGHSMWGTEIDAIAWGGFAKQYISPNLNLGSTPNEDKWLSAPTFTLPQPCPVEVGTLYWYNANSNSNDGELNIFDFYNWATYGLSAAHTHMFDFDDTRFVFDTNTDNPYYFTEIHYWWQLDEWDVYFWRRDLNTWELKYTQTHSFTDFWQHDYRISHGWDSFEAISPDNNGYDNSWAGVHIQNPVRSSSLMLYLLDSPYIQPPTLHWEYASSSNSYEMDRWSYGFPPQYTPFTQWHYFAVQYSDWIVVSDPPLTVLAYDESTDTFFDGIPFSINNNIVGETSTTIPMTAGTYTFGAHSDHLDYIDIGGTPVYDNPISITLDEDPVTIILHYYSIPTYTITVYAYDAYLGGGSPSTTDVYVDGNYAGTVGTYPVSVEVPIGDHTVTVDYMAYNPSWGDYGTIYEVTGDYYGFYNIYSYTPVDVHLLVFYDTTINAVYSMW